MACSIQMLKWECHLTCRIRSEPKCWPSAEQAVERIPRVRDNYMGVFGLWPSRKALSPPEGTWDRADGDQHNSGATICGIGVLLRNRQVLQDDRDVCRENKESRQFLSK